MSLGFPVLLSSKSLAPAYRWRLIDGMYASWRPPIEGWAAIATVAAISQWRTGDWAFGGVFLASILIVGARMLHARHYMRASRSGSERRGTPEHWAWQFSVGGVLTASLWGVLNVLALRTGDTMLLMLIVAVQSGWLGASTPRNAALPMTALGQSLGILLPGAFCMIVAKDPFIRLLAPFAIIQFTATVGIARKIGAQITSNLLTEQSLEAANARLTELSATDGLTGIANRRAFDLAFQAEWGRAAREGTDLAVLMIDVDCFKAYNDHYGHPAGDECLRLVAETTAAALRRPPDTAARFGGEEFVALLPGADAVAATQVAERVRLSIMAEGVAHAGSDFGRVTVSIGTASMAPQPGQDSQTLIDFADRALYEAKQSGRNMVRCAGLGVRIGAWSPAP